MSDWLESLTPPTGLFACNDIRGQQVSNVCRGLALQVLDDVAFIAVDDDEICPFRGPQLSSDCPVADQPGYRAAEMSCRNSECNGKWNDGGNGRRVRSPNQSFSGC